MGYKRIALNNIDFTETVHYKDGSTDDKVWSKDGEMRICTILHIKDGHLLIHQDEEQFSFQIKQLGGFPLILN